MNNSPEPFPLVIPEDGKNLWLKYTQGADSTRSASFSLIPFILTEKSWVLWRVQRQRKHHRPAKTWGQKAIFLFLCVFVFVLRFKMTEIYAWKKIYFWDFIFKQHHISEEGKVILSSFVPYRVVLRGQTVDGEPYFESTSRKNAKGPTRLWSFLKFHSNLCGVLYWAIFSCGKLLRRVLNEKREIF